ncbi:MAG: hypothetical protein ABI629_05745, partial [bacterium]
MNDAAVGTGRQHLGGRIVGGGEEVEHRHIDLDRGIGGDGDRAGVQQGRRQRIGAELAKDRHSHRVALGVLAIERRRRQGAETGV